MPRQAIGISSANPEAFSVPLNGFDNAARNAYLYGLQPVKKAIVDAETRDGVSWGGTTNSRAFLILVDAVRKYGEPYRIRINGLMSARITVDPISFLANKTDHYIPDDCKIEFTNIPMRES
jgi:hypothetical protein